jgi:hypothetical protein
MPTKAWNVWFLFRCLTIFQFHQYTHALRIAGECRGSAAGARNIGLVRKVDSLPHPNTTDLDSPVPVLSVWTRNSMERNNFREDMNPDFGRAFGIGSAEYVGRVP